MTLKNYYLLFSAIIIISIKWLFSNHFFDEELSTKIIFESVGDGASFYPQIKYLSQMVFDQSFDRFLFDCSSILEPTWAPKSKQKWIKNRLQNETFFG